MRLVLAVFVLALIGCNGNKDKVCCLNKAYYKCANAEEAANCKPETGPGNCKADPSKDAECKNK